MHQPRLQRKLAAVLIADVVGYSGLIGRDETGTLRQLRIIRRELVDPAVARHHGRIVKTTGDGILIEFPSAVEAVRCAVVIQQAMAHRPREIPLENRIAFRVGIHQGDIVVEDQDIFGDGVNVAARLETLSEPGGICVSERVYEDTVGRFELPFEDKGKQQVKNIARPVQAYSLSLHSISELPPLSAAENDRADSTNRIAALWPPAARRLLWAAAVLLLVLGVGGAGVWYTGWAPWNRNASVLSGSPTVGVLPFDNLSGDANQDFFSQAISEELITVLSRFDHLRVLARNTTFAYKGRTLDLAELGRKLGAQYLIEGSLRRVPDRISVTAQLIDARDGTHVWARTYERSTSTDLLRLQDEIAQDIGAQVGDLMTGAISFNELERSRNKPVRELSNYECILQQATNQIPTAVQPIWRSRECLESMIKRDPGYAEGWARLSIILLTQRFYGTALNSPESEDIDKRAYLIDRIVETANRAVELAPRSRDARMALFQAYYATCQPGRMRVEADRVLAINPNDAGAMAVMGNLLAFAGEWDFGRQLAERGIALAGPGAPRWWWWAVAKDHYRKGEYDKALEYFQRSYVEQNWLDHLHLVYTLPYLGRSVEAKSHIDKLLQLKPQISVQEADRYYKMWCFDQDFRSRMIEALRLAGLREEVPISRQATGTVPDPH